MEILTTTSDLRSARRALPGSVAFVPTMGFLHDGHLALMREARARADHLVVSIFVNPTQFGPDEDLDNYPRDLKGDIEKCRLQGCDLLFTPTVEELYADDDSTRVVVDKLDQSLCGPRRPGHFQGVTTIVAKFFNLIAPDFAVFGQKDYQQLATVRRMVRDLHFPISIIGVPTVREPDGLAMSSRNRYLSPEERREAPVLSRALLAAHRAYADGERRVQGLESTARALIENVPTAIIDYIECVHPDTLQPPESGVATEEGLVMALAVFFGSARLIDNLRLDQPLPEDVLRSLP